MSLAVRYYLSPSSRPSFGTHFGLPLAGSTPAGDISYSAARARIVFVRRQLDAVKGNEHQLQMDDVDYVSKALLVREKFGNERRLPITTVVQEALTEYLADHPAIASRPVIRSYLEPSCGLTRRP